MQQSLKCGYGPKIVIPGAWLLYRKRPRPYRSGKYICLFSVSELQGGLNPDTTPPRKLPGKSEHQRDCSREAIRARLQLFDSNERQYSHTLDKPEYRGFYRLFP